ncbi:ATP-dependent helicase HrpB [Gulosibacter massiliensis]|uniref:ATP-dependent helicase HrpB n=1 Tax=Gulosibacter massiliensis TaxID=2479839 RepID=UPI000F633BC9|nr:ATP-dependent helicase HrpB [Gulosibacter massiliensis]
MFDLTRIAEGLPAATLLPQLRDALAKPGARAVVAAPPGSGKTTVVAPAVAELADGRVIVTQPRRIATRAAASRLAQLSGTRLGDAVGYSVRGERRTSAATRVEFVTAGLLVRRLLADPELAGVDAVVLDEVHERSLDSDLAIGMLGELGQLRDDLTLVAMSATLDVAAWTELLGPGTRACEVDVAPHPLEVRWAPPPRDVRPLDERGVTRDFLSHVTRVSADAFADVPAGSALVFLPGAREVDRVAEGLRARGIPTESLTGSLSLEEQQRVLRPNGERRAIVATAIAETSLTVPDVRLVIDAGLSREPRIDLARDMAQLVTVSVSQAAATQRAGRAARVGPGSVVRCYAELDWPRLAPAPTPEIASAELTPFALTLAAWGDPDASELPLPQRPPVASLQRAQATLRNLGALDEAGLTARGREFASIPAHPRIARALLDAAPRLGATRAAEYAAAIESDRRAPGGDLAALVRQLRDGRDASSQRWRDDARRLRELVPPGRATTSVGDDAGLAEVIALAYPERLARARGGGYQLASGTGATLPRGSALTGHDWLAVAEVARATTTDASGAVIRAAVPIDPESAREFAGPLVRTTTVTQWRDGRVRATRETRLGEILLASSPHTPNPQEARDAVARELERVGLGLLRWSTAADELRRRLALLHRTLGAPWPDVNDGALLARLDDWLAPELDRLARGSTAASIDLLDPLRRLLPWPDAARLAELAPERLEVPTGSMVRVQYAEHDTDGPPVLAVKLQECFGWVDTPRLVDGRVPVLLHLLSPAQRPLAITDDLASFWSGPYTQVRAEMRGRYPKHPWPEDPLNAPPRRGTTRSGR